MRIAVARASRGALLLSVTVFAAAGNDAPGSRTDPTPPAAGLTETVGVTLALLDVEVTDAKGRPVRGLSKKDFSVRLDHRQWPIYSVDDLCGCDEGGAGTRGAAGQPAVVEPPVGGAEGRTASHDDTGEVLQFVLYFDFSQLQVGGRSRAIAEARRWVRETRRPDERVLVAAYSSTAGPKELCPFTSDAAVLLSAIDRAAKDPALSDPFPDFLHSRQTECQWSIDDCRRDRFKICEFPTLVCSGLAQDEYRHGRQSLQALKLFLGGLEGTPGRKSLILFQQNGTLLPREFFPFVGERHVSDHQRLLEQVGAEATGSRTSIFSAYVGDGTLGGGGLDLVSELAEFTGGDFNRDIVALTRLATRARAECACIYRIGLEPRGRVSGHVYRAVVEVRGEPVKYSYRLRFLDRFDRWLRQASAILANPSRATGIDLAAAVVPVRASGGLWDVSVQVSLDLKDLVKIPSAGGTQAAWEVGALLVRSDGTRTWEMLAESSVSRGVDTTSRKAMLHHRELQRLDAGRYRLAAFVRDRASDVFGGAEVKIDLPARKKPGVVGPLVMHSRRFLALPLPILGKTSAEAAHSTETRDGPLPVSSNRSSGADAFEMLTWICAEGAPPRPERVLRYVARDGKPVSRFGPATIEPAGECFRIRDRIAVDVLETGGYTYHLRWPRPSPAPPLTASASFVVGPRPDAEEKSSPALPSSPTFASAGRPTGVFGYESCPDRPSRHT